MIGPARPSEKKSTDLVDQGAVAVAGPSRPSSLPSSITTAAGPTLPPHLQARHASHVDKDEDEDEVEDDDDDDDYAPALPPSMASKHTSKTAQGPALPPHLANRQRSPSPAYSEEDSDSDVGPQPVASTSTGGQRSGPSLSAAEEFRLRERERQEEADRRQAAEAGKSKREDWMLVPPSSFDLASSTDPTKIKARGFAQNTRRGGPANSGSGGDGERNLWTETPEERAKRLDDEVMGKRKRASNSGPEETESQRRERLKRERRDAEIRERVGQYNAATSRDKSLVEKHQDETAQQAKEREEESRKKAKRKHRKASRSPSPEAPAFWDHAAMMGSGARLMDEGKRKEIIGSSSVNLSSKFGGGSYL